MKPFTSRLGPVPGWLVWAVLAAVLYGILNDQITVTLSPEYFSVFKRQQFMPALVESGFLLAPTRIQAMLVGTLSTWWFGLFLGVILSACSTVGRHLPLPTVDYRRAVCGVMLISFGLSVIFGIAGYLIQPLFNMNVYAWPFLQGIHDVRPAFAVGCWHDGAYLGGLAGTVMAGLWAQRRRALLDPAPLVPAAIMQR